MARRPMTRIGSWLRRGALSLAVLAGALALLRWLRPGATPGSFAVLVQQASDRELARRMAPRPITHGEVTADNAFDHYHAAMRAWDAIRREHGIGHITWEALTVRVRASRRKEWTTLAGVELAEFRRRIAPALRSLQRGAHASDMTPRPRPATSPILLCYLLETEVGVRLLEGEVAGAVALWLDAITFELDVDAWHRHNGSVWTDAKIAALPAAAAAQLSAGLAVLDQRLDRANDTAAAMASYVMPLLEDRYRITDWGVHEVLASWEFGFDPTARHLAAFEALFAELHRLEPAATTGQARAAQWDDFAAAAPGLAVATALSTHAAEWTRNREQERRRLLTRYRQLRIGLAAKRGQPLPELRDPFTGAPFAIERTATELIVHATAPPHGPGPANWSLPAPAELGAPPAPAAAGR